MMSTCSSEHLAALRELRRELGKLAGKKSYYDPTPKQWRAILKGGSLHKAVCKLEHFYDDDLLPAFALVRGQMLKPRESWCELGKLAGIALGKEPNPDDLDEDDFIRGANDHIEVIEDWAISEEARLRAGLVNSSDAGGQNTGTAITRETPPIERWPPDEGWHFKHGYVWYRGVRYPLAPKPAALLERFLKAGETPLGKNELVSAAWPTGNVVEEDALYAQLKKLRKLLRKIAKDIGASDKIVKDPIPHKSGGWRFLLPTV